MNKAAEEAKVDGGAADVEMKEGANPSALVDKDEDDDLYEDVEDGDSAGDDDDEAMLLRALAMSKDIDQQQQQ